MVYNWLIQLVEYIVYILASQPTIIYYDLLSVVTVYSHHKKKRDVGHLERIGHYIICNTWIVVSICWDRYTCLGILTSFFEF
jgi:hypothetical protein